MKRLLLLALICCFSSPVISQVSLQDKIGQMVMVGFSSGTASKDTLKKDLRDRNLGGVILFAHNLQIAFQMRNLTNELKSYSQDYLFIATDQEGGTVARLSPKNGFPTSYSAAQLGIFNSEDSTRKMAKTMAGWLESVGINVNLAPVADVNINPNSPAIGKLNRSYSSDATLVTKHVEWFADEFHQKKISTALKHFPGHGSALNDSHNGFTDISNTWQREELEPFENLINSGYSDMIMTGHLFKENWDNTYPASLSKYAISTLLRDSLGFNGVVISDELFMKAISDNFGLDEAILTSIKAGTDILLFYGNLYEGNSITRRVIELVSQKIIDGELDEDLIHQAYERIQTLKQKRLATSLNYSESVQKVESHLLSAFPNPFNPTSTLLVTLAEAGAIEIDLYSVLGQKVASLFSGFAQQGTVSFSINGSRLTSGVYLIVLKSKQGTQQLTITLAK